MEIKQPLPSDGVPSITTEATHIVDVDDPKKPTKAVVPLPLLKSSLAQLPQSTIEDFIGDLQSAIAKKDGKTWSQWLASLDKTKLTGWVVAAVVLAGQIIQAWRAPQGPPPVPANNNVAPIVRPDDKNDRRPQPNVKPFGEEVQK